MGKKKKIEEPEVDAIQEVEVEAELDEEEQEEKLAANVALVEALLFAHGEPLPIADLKSVAKLKDKELEEVIDVLQARCSELNSGLELKKVSDKYQFRTKKEFGAKISELKTGRPRKLTPAALETVAIIAYRQPIIRSDVEKLRGVDATPTIKTLLERKLIRIVGHQPTVGQPALFGTTEEFLKLFGIASLGELPTLRDLRELEADPGELEEDFEEETDELEASDAAEDETQEIEVQASHELESEVGAEEIQEEPEQSVMVEDAQESRAANQ